MFLLYYSVFFPLSFCSLWQRFIEQQILKTLKVKQAYNKNTFARSVHVYKRVFCLWGDISYLWRYWVDITYLGPSHLLEHRPWTTILQRARSLAVFSIWVQMIPIFFSSVSVSRLQLFLGRPLFRLPWWFQVRDWRVTLLVGLRNVCPIQPHFLVSLLDWLFARAPRCWYGQATRSWICALGIHWWKSGSSAVCTWSFSMSPSHIG